MKVKDFSMEKQEARRMWLQYREALKKQPSDKFLLDMKKVYNVLKSGRKVIDITTVIQRAGINDRFEPKMAIACASSNIIFCTYRENGTVRFQNDHFDQYYVKRKDVEVREALPPLPKEQFEEAWHSYKRMTAFVPKIPAPFIPAVNLKNENYYVLWEVKEWKRVPPKDPFLLRRITPNMFVVLAAWNLSKLERAVMKGRVY